MTPARRCETNAVALVLPRAASTGAMLWECCRQGTPTAASARRRCPAAARDGGGGAAAVYAGAAMPMYIYVAEGIIYKRNLIYKHHMGGASCIGTSWGFLMRQPCALRHATLDPRTFLPSRPPFM